MATQKIDTTKLAGFLGRTRTIAEVAEKFTVTKATANKYVRGLVSSGLVVASSNQPTGRRGRPATLYVASPPSNG